MLAVQVAIHIRTGALEDAAGPLLAGANVPDNLRFDLAHYSAVFDCARQVSSALTKGANADVPWFLATDSKQLRQSASAHYGAQLQSASTHGAIGHIDPFEQCVYLYHVSQSSCNRADLRCVQASS